MYYIYFIDLLISVPNTTLKSSYDCTESALDDLELIALNYIREQEGIKQSSIALQNNKDINQILADDTLKEGLYLKRVENSVLVYQKQKIILTGKLWNSYEMKIDKIGVFGITSSNINSKNTQEPIIKAKTIKIIHDNKHNSLMDELNKLFNNSTNFGLKKQHSD